MVPTESVAARPPNTQAAAATKRCTRCGAVLPLAAFGRPQRRRSKCGPCERELDRVRGRQRPLDLVGARICRNPACGRSFGGRYATGQHSGWHYCSGACLLAALGLPAGFDVDALTRREQGAVADWLYRRATTQEGAGNG